MVAVDPGEAMLRVATFEKPLDHALLDVTPESVSR
jgi:hypothetical protein